jgi:hypothetical protein
MKRTQGGRPFTVQQRVPVRTQLGVLQGRDCIFLDRVSLADRTNTLTLEGDISGNLAELRSPGMFLPYTLVFSGVLALRILELDSWSDDPKSSFDEIHVSLWMAELRSATSSHADDSHHHYCVQTYDDVIDVVCTSFVLTIRAARSR